MSEASTHRPFVFTVIEDDGVNVTIKISEEDYLTDLAAGIDEEDTLRPGRYKMKRGGFHARHPELRHQNHMKGQTLQEWAGSSEMFALVFTDNVDSTTLANELGDEKWIELLKRHFGQARRLMAKYNHHEVKIIGDAFMVVFHSASDALDFALDLYEDTGDERIKIRAGIHVGSASIVEDDMFGVMVNYTKRVESTENPKGIKLSDFAKTEIDNRGRHAALRFRPADVSLRGFSAPQRTWWVIDPRWVIREPFRPPPHRAGANSRSS